MPRGSLDFASYSPASEKDAITLVSTIYRAAALIPFTSVSILRVLVVPASAKSRRRASLNSGQKKRICFTSCFLHPHKHSPLSTVGICIR